tara:strand:- start:73 stop:360 length:288 start_codon:yes stop_codon:yes gene_type:complete
VVVTPKLVKELVKELVKLLPDQAETEVLVLKISLNTTTPMEIKKIQENFNREIQQISGREIREHFHPVIRVITIPEKADNSQKIHIPVGALKCQD